MSNIQFPKLTFPRLTPKTFHPLRGHIIPPRSMVHHGAVGNYIDQLIKTHLRNPFHANTVVDLIKFGIEIKSKDIDTNTSWSIGSMTIADIVNTPYVNSSIYAKMQALLLVTTNHKFGSITDTMLVYLDMDEVQVPLEQTYESLRKQLTVKWNAYQAKVKAHLDKGELAEAYKPMVFSPWENVKADYGMFEYMSGTSYQFRMSQTQMNFITDTALKQTGFEKHFVF